jgi:hypothetical protein
MSDVAFNGKATVRGLYRFRQRNAAAFFYIAANTLHEASVKLAHMGLDGVEQITYEGQLVAIKEDA